MHKRQTLLLDALPSEGGKPRQVVRMDYVWLFRVQYRCHFARHPRMVRVQHVKWRFQGGMYMFSSPRPVQILQSDVIDFHSMYPAYLSVCCRSHTYYNRIVSCLHYTFSKRLDETLCTSQSIRSIQSINKQNFQILNLPLFINCHGSCNVHEVHTKLYT